MAAEPGDFYERQAAEAAAASTELKDLTVGHRVRVQGGKNFEKFHGGMEGDILENSPENQNMSIQFDEKSEPMSVAYRHLEFAPARGGYSYKKTAATGGSAAAQAPKDEPVGEQLDEHEGRKMGQLVQVCGIKSAPELNGRLGRLQKFDVGAGRWECQVRNMGSKRLKPENIMDPEKPVVPKDLSIAELKAQGNDFFKERFLEKAIAFYGAAINKAEDEQETELEEPCQEEIFDDDGSAVQENITIRNPMSHKRHETHAAEHLGLTKGQRQTIQVPQPRKDVAILYSNRCQCYIIIAREAQVGKELNVKETRAAAMRANMDAARAIELDPTNGKAYYRRGCAMLGMAPSASRAKEAIINCEIAVSGRASGSKTGIVLPNQMRDEVNTLLDASKERLDSCTETASLDPSGCKQS